MTAPSAAATATANFLLTRGGLHERCQRRSHRFAGQFRIFPAQDARGREKLRAVRQQLYALQPQFCSVTYGAGGSTQEGTFRHGAVHPGRRRQQRPRISPALVPRASRCARSWRCSRAWACAAGGAARRLCPAAMAAWAANSSTPAIWWPSSAPKRGGTSTSRWPPTPRCIPQAKSPEADLQAYVAKVRRVPIRPSRSISSTADAYFRFVDEARTSWAPTCPWCRASCPSSSSTQLMRFSDSLRRRDSALDPAAPAGFGDDTASSRPLAWMW
jgi:methylenetetrahydrofolate reductase (NADPH)